MSSSAASKGKNKEKYDYCRMPLHPKRYFLPKIKTKEYIIRIFCNLCKRWMHKSKLIFPDDYYGCVETII